MTEDRDQLGQCGKFRPDRTDLLGLSMTRPPANSQRKSTGFVASILRRSADAYQIHEVDGVTFSDRINTFNKLVPEWPVLQQRHFTKGYWWLVYLNEKPVAFAGLVPFEPLPNIGYLKRCYVYPDHHGHGLQFRLMMARELKAKQLGWTHLVSECRVNNKHSSANFIKAGFIQCEPEQPWERDSVYWVKAI
jgi:GNAT superfamily N-acetyltransferase